MPTIQTQSTGIISALTSLSQQKTRSLYIGKKDGEYVLGEKQESQRCTPSEIAREALRALQTHQETQETMLEVASGLSQIADRSEAKSKRWNCFCRPIWSHIQCSRSRDLLEAFEFANGQTYTSTSSSLSLIAEHIREVADRQREERDQSFIHFVMELCDQYPQFSSLTNLNGTRFSYISSKEHLSYAREAFKGDLCKRYFAEIKNLDLSSLDIVLTKEVLEIISAAEEVRPKFSEFSLRRLALEDPEYLLNAKWKDEALLEVEELDLRMHEAKICEDTRAVLHECPKLTMLQLSAQTVKHLLLNDIQFFEAQFGAQVLNGIKSLDLQDHAEILTQGQIGLLDNMENLQDCKLSMETMQHLLIQYPIIFSSEWGEKIVGNLKNLDISSHKGPVSEETTELLLSIDGLNFNASQETLLHWMVTKPEMFDPEKRGMGLERITNLDLRQVQLPVSKETLDILAGMKNLKGLDITQEFAAHLLSDHRDFCMTTFGKKLLNRIEELDLSSRGEALDKDMLSVIQRMNRLKTLVLKGIPQTSLTLSSRSISTLNVEDCQLGELDVKKCANLGKIFASNNSLKIVRGASKTWEELDLSSTNISSARSLAKATNLKTLKLANLKGRVTSFNFKKMKSLEMVDLTGNTSLTQVTFAKSEKNINVELDSHLDVRIIKK